MTTNKLIVIVFLLVTATRSFAAVDTVSVEKAFTNNQIQLEIFGKGGYQGHCIEMQLKNKQRDSILIYIEAGRRLDSKDSTEQDILIVQDMFVMLSAEQSKIIDIKGFCCQANHHGPSLKSIFYVGAMAVKELLQLGRYLNTAKLSNSAIQNAIWSISDNHELSSIVEDGTEDVSNLRKFVAKIKGVELPWYNIIYKTEKDKLFSGIPEKVTGIVNYYISDVAQVYANIRDAKGIVVQSFQVGNYSQQGNYTFELYWDVRLIPKGLYTFYLYENGRQIKASSIRLN